MNGKWIEIFRAGKQTDSNGNTREWTEADLDAVVAKYNGQTDHEAPVVVGHPEHNSPAFGYAEKLKREGKVLLAKLKQVPDAFTEMVKAGTYKKRSMALYPDLTLRHIGFLGGMPPAVKGLADIAFRNGEEATTYEFCDMDDMTVARLFRRLRDFIISQFGQEKADQVIPDYEVTGLQVSACMPGETPMGGCPQFSEKESDMKPEEVKALITEAVTAATQAFSEQVKVLGEQNRKLGEQVAGLQQQFVEQGEEAARRGFTAFCEGLKTRIIPAEIPTLVDQMMNLSKAPAVEFSEGGEKKSLSAVEDFQARLRNRAETIQFGEFATGDRAWQRGGKGEDATAIAQKAQEYMESEAKAGRVVTIADAVTHVQAGKGGAE